MTQTDLQLIDRIRSMAQYNEHELSDEDILVSIESAKNELITEIPQTNVAWYSENIFTEALFWTALLNTQIQSQRLGSKGMSADDLSEDTLRANGVQGATMWFQKYRQARNRMVGYRGSSNLTQPNRTQPDGNRYYE